MRFSQPGRDARRGDGGGADMEFLPRLAEIGHHAPEVHLGGGDFAPRRLNEEIQQMRPAIRVPDHQEPPAEEGGENRLRHAGRQRPGDHGVHGTASGVEGVRGGVSGDLVARGDCVSGHKGRVSGKGGGVKRVLGVKSRLTY